MVVVEGLPEEHARRIRRTWQHMNSPDSVYVLQLMEQLLHSLAKRGTISRMAKRTVPEVLSASADGHHTQAKGLGR